jgi:ElaB/YqjD/DUF883 family membrane-anchored ribosome-binding protein
VTALAEMTSVDLSSVALSSAGNGGMQTAELSAELRRQRNQQQQEHARMQRAETKRSVACSCMTDTIQERHGWSGICITADLNLVHSRVGTQNGAT